MKEIFMIILCVLCVSCTTTQTQIGTKNWHTQRTAEIEQAYQNKEIDKAKYLELKNEADKIRADYLNDYSNTHSHIGYGSHTGGSLGIGVDF